MSKNPQEEYEKVLRDARAVAFTNQAALSGHSADLITKTLPAYEEQFDRRRDRLVELSNTIPEFVKK